MANLFIFEKDESGVTASHPQTLVLPVIAAPVPEEQKGKNFNAIREPLVLLGCKELPNDHFEFDSSFVGPRSKKAFANLKKLLDVHRQRDERKRFPPSALFGHADPTGGIGYNRMLSGRRAVSVYGVLTKNPDIWGDLFSYPYKGDIWGTKAIQTMLSISLITLQPINLPEAPFYQAEIDGGKTEATRKATAEAVSAYREARGMGKGTSLTPSQRKQLFKEYMDAICNGPDFKLAPTDFIAKGQGGAGLKGDVMGNLVETPIEQTGNTMACRFYHGFAQNSPCEAKFKEWVVRFQVSGFNGKVVTLKNRRFVAVLGESASAPEMRGTTDDFGAVRLPVISEKTKMRVKLDAARDLEPDEKPPADGDDAAGDESRFITVELAAGDLEVRDTDNDLAIKQRLYNLGFGENPPSRWDEKVDVQQTEFERALAAFRARNQLEDASDDEVRQRIVQDHDLADPEPPPDDDAASAAPAADA